MMLAGEKSPRTWHGGKAKGFDAFDAKAEVLALLEAAGAPIANLQLSMGAGETWHPGRSATLGLGKNSLAAFGELHPGVAKALDIPAGTIAAEVYLDAIPVPRTAETCASRLYAAGTSVGHSRFRLYGPGRSGGGRAGAGHSRAPTRPSSAKPGCSTAMTESRGLAWPSK
jgi:hypothetical protein